MLFFIGAKPHAFLGREIETGKGRGRNLPHVTGLTSLNDFSSVPSHRFRTKAETKAGSVTPNAVLGFFSGVRPKHGRSGPLCDTFGEVNKLLSVQSPRGQNWTTSGF